MIVYVLWILIFVFHMFNTLLSIPVSKFRGLHTTWYMSKSQRTPKFSPPKKPLPHCTTPAHYSSVLWHIKPNEKSRWIIHKAPQLCQCDEQHKHCINVKKSCTEIVKSILICCKWENLVESKSLVQMNFLCWRGQRED